MSVNAIKFAMKFFCDADYEKNILYELKKLHLNEKFCDAVVISGVDAISIKVHRVVLAASSEFFTNMFAVSAPENKNNEFIIEEIEGKVLESLVDFIYTGKIEMKMEEIGNLLIGAEIFQLTKVSDAAIDFVSEQINVENFIKISFLGERINSKKLIKTIDEFIKGNFLEVSKSENFLQLTAPKLYQLIESNELNVDSQEDILNGVKYWVNFDRNYRKKFVTELLDLIKMYSFLPDFIDKNVVPVRESIECDQLNLDSIFYQIPISEDAIQQESEPPLKFLAVGRNSDQQKNYLLKYSAETNNWTSWKEISYDGYLRSCCLLNQKLFFIDGYEIICYDVQKNHSEPKPMKNFRKKRWNPIIAVFQESIYVMGGFGNENFVEKWDSKTNEWSDVADMITGRREFRTEVLNDLLFVVGGFNRKFLKSTECFNPQLNSWSDLAPMNEKRANHGLTTDGRFIYAVGGVNADGKYSKTVEFYDPEINQWTLMSNSMSEPRAYFGCIFFKNNIYAVGGYDTKGQSDTIEIFDYETEKWNYGRFLPKALSAVFIFLNI